MKIIIGPKESYELEIPQAEISFEEFRTLVKKLNVVVQFVENKDTSAKQISQTKKSTQPRTREEVKDILTKFFAMMPGTPEMEEALKRYNLTYQTVNQYKWKWIDKFRFTPQDLGVEKFPDKQAGRPPIK